MAASEFKVSKALSLLRSTFIENPIGGKDAAVGVEVEEFAESLDSNDRPGSSLLLWNRAKGKFSRQPHAQRLNSERSFRS
jgi:hypothetical protein